MINEDMLDHDEKKVYEIIVCETSASGGIPQKALKSRPELKDLGGKRINQIVKKLVELKMIKRSVSENNGKRVYVLTAITDSDSGERKNSDMNDSILQILSLLEVPCIKCRYLFSCGVGHLYDPLKCSTLTQFIIEKSGIINYKFHRHV